MFIAELFENESFTGYVTEDAPRLVVLYPGRFQPFHLGHKDVFNALQGKFGRDNVWITTSNKVELPKSPFNFTDKSILMHAAGIPTDRIIESSNPYKIPPQFDPAKIIFIVAIGAPDRDRLKPDSYKKDGSPAYFKTFTSLSECVLGDQHGYVIIADERKKNITVGGKAADVSHGTESRELWNQIRNNPEQRNEFLMQMYNRNDPEIGRVLDKIPQSVSESTDYMESKKHEVISMLSNDIAKIKEDIAHLKSKTIAEAFDAPYGNMTWEKSQEDESYDVLIKLPDGSNLTVMFNQDYDDEGEGIYSIEFWRNNSQDITGEGDAQRIFATVLHAIQEFIKKKHPERFYFSATKEVDSGQNSQSRAKLYDRLVQRYATAWGYKAHNEDRGDRVIYELTKLQQTMSEGFESKQQVIDYFVSKGKSAAEGANAWERGWRGAKPKKKLSPFDPKYKPKSVDNSRYGEKDISEEAAGVGVVKNSKDPRYSMATMGDQNEVTGDTLNKEMKAYGLTGRKPPKKA